MSSIALKFTSLAIRTLSKPIANYIKKQAREHPGFRKTCIGFAQSIHRVDMRWRIGLLQDAASLERQAKRHAAEDAAKKQKATVPTVKTEAQTKAEEEAAAKGGSSSSSSSSSSNEPSPPKPKIRPLSEAKAIETGANFISETFLFSVAAGLILFESWRSRRKETNRREDVKERLDDLEESEKAARRALIELEHEVLRLRAAGVKDGSKNNNVAATALQKRILPKEVYDPPKDSDKPGQDLEKGWFARIARYVTSRDQATESEGAATATTTITATKLNTTDPQPDHKTEDSEAQKEANSDPDSESLGPAERILVESDKELEEKHKQQQLADEEAARKAAATSPLSALKRMQRKEDDK